MKKLLFLFLTVLLPLGASAQNQTIYMFDQFIKVRVLLKNKTENKANANYDAGQKRLMFGQGNVIMESTNVEVIDTIYFGERRFIPGGKCLYEVVKVPHGTVKIDWWLKNVMIGSKGALGSVTQGSVHQLQMSNLGLNSTEMYTPYENSRGNSNEIYRRKNANVYYVTVGGKEYKLKELPNLYKQFPDKAEQLKAYAKENKLDLRTADNALKMLDYLLSL